jgi:hypothetical protein
MFSDSVYGGKEAARRAARNFRGSALRGAAKAASAKRGKPARRGKKTAPPRRAGKKRH